MADEQSRFLIFFFLLTSILFLYPFLKGIKRTIQIPTTKKLEADKQKFHINYITVSHFDNIMQTSDRQAGISS